MSNLDVALHMFSNMGTCVLVCAAIHSGNGDSSAQELVQSDYLETKECFLGHLRPHMVSEQFLTEQHQEVMATCRSIGGTKSMATRRCLQVSNVDHARRYMTDSDHASASLVLTETATFASPCALPKSSGRVYCHTNRLCWMSYVTTGRI